MGKNGIVTWIYISILVGAATHTRTHTHQPNKRPTHIKRVNICITFGWISIYHAVQLYRSFSGSENTYMNNNETRARGREREIYCLNKYANNSNNKSSI